MGDAKAEVAELSEVDFGVGAVVLGDVGGDGNGVATALDPEFEANVPGAPDVPGAPVLLAAFEFDAVPADFDRSAAFLFADDDDALR